jgi:hypothetical protein
MKDGWLCPYCGKDFCCSQTYQGGRRMIKIECGTMAKINYITPEQYHELIERRKDKTVST